MGNLEHLIENTLVCIENKLPYERILDFIKNDPNFEGNPLSVDEVWEVCQIMCNEFTKWGLSHMKGMRNEE